VIRFLLGVVAGIAATVYFFQTGGGDYFVSSSTKVRHLEEQLQHADQQHDNLAKKLEEATAVIEKMTTQFTALEQRFQTLTLSPEKPAAETPPPAEASPTAPAQESGSATGSGSVPEPSQERPSPEESGPKAANDPPPPQ
jgi:uncharacterized coiled-coil protein SlyX